MVPHHMGLRKAVQQHDRRAVAFGAREDATDLRVDPVGFEAGEKIVGHGALRRGERVALQLGEEVRTSSPWSDAASARVCAPS